MQSVRHFEDEMEARHKEFEQTVRPAYKKYFEKEKQVHSEFSKYLKKHAVNEFGCDSKCVDRCCNASYITFWEMPVCVEKCKCNQKFIKLTGGSYNYAGMALYAEGDMDAYNYFLGVSQ